MRRPTLSEKKSTAAMGLMANVANASSVASANTTGASAAIVELPALPKVTIKAEPKFSPENSEATRSRWVFFYTITIGVEGKLGAQLLSRYWKITSANADVQEINGEGVVGEQPHILPKQSYQYESFCILPTPLGWMEGHYQMVDDEGRFFTVPIARFRLEVAGVLQ